MRKMEKVSFLKRVKRFIRVNLWAQKFRMQAFGKWYPFTVFYSILNRIDDTVDILILGAMLNEVQRLVTAQSTDISGITRLFIYWLLWNTFVRIIWTTYWRFQWYFKQYGFTYTIEKSIIEKLIRLNWKHIETPLTEKRIRQSLSNSQYHLQELGSIHLEIVSLLISLVLAITAANIPLWVFAIILVKEIPSIILHTITNSKTFKLNESTNNPGIQKDSIVGYFRHFPSLAEIKISNAHRRLSATFTSLYNQIVKAYWKKDSTAYIPDIAKDVYEISINSGLYLYYLLKVVYNGLPFGTFQATTGIIREIGNSVYNFISKSSSILDHYRYAGYIYDFLHTPNDFTPGKRILDSDNINIEFKNVSFRYPGANKDSLTNVSLTIHDNDRLAIVGENGAGKSTFLKLLTLLYQPTEGQILVNSIPLEEYDPSSIYQKLAIVSQEFARYDVLTVAENIAIYGNSPSIDEEKMKQAAKLSTAEDFIIKLENGYDTLLTKKIEGGTELSTGQWQRLAVARQFYANRPLVVLDEPTSAIDPVAEATIFNNLYEHVKEKTVIVVSHRYNTVKAASRILVFQDGQIIEQGDHDSLLKENGYYANAYKLQNEEKKL